MANVLEFSFNISSSNKNSGLSFFKICWFDPLTVQGTLRSLLQHHSSKALILWHSASLRFSSRNLATGKAIAMTIQMFVGREMSLLFNTLSRFVIAFQ